MSVNKVKVLVLGQSGMLGHMVMRVLKENSRLALFGTQMSDRAKPGYFNILEGKEGLQRIFKKHSGFDYCINCIGLTGNRINENDRSSVKKARLINTVFPRQLAKVAKRYGCKVIHISTDGVFLGRKPYYYENSRPDCADVYGRTKLGGEITADNFLTIRCSILGPSPYEHAGLWEWFVSLPAGSCMRGFTNHIWNGVTTLQFSRLCRAIILKGCFSALRGKSGIYHFAPNKPLNKFALLEMLKHSLKKDVEIKRTIQGTGKLSRILRSRFRILRELSPYDMTMQQAINQLLLYERKKHG